MVMNKRGWIKIVEAFISVIFIAIVLLIVINQGALGKANISARVSEIETLILREIQSNETLRGDVLLNDELPIESEDFPQRLDSEIKNKIPGYLDCVAKICYMNLPCILDNPPQKDIYTKSIGITSTLTKLSYRQLKLFCWRRE
jgi:hypothetical protein